MGQNCGKTMVNSKDWLVVFHPTPLKNDGVKVSWNDDIANIWKNKKVMFQTTNQKIPDKMM